MLLSRLLALTVVGIVWQMPGCDPPLECMTFDSGPITSGASYSHPIQRGLVFRFTSETARGLDDHQAVWHITVGPAQTGDRIDYVWPVSPPINSTHHLFVGPGLDWTAADSVRLNPRQLQFVLSAEALRVAATLYQEITKQVVRDSVYDSSRLSALGNGTLTVTLDDVAFSGPAIASLRIEVQSCVPG